MKIATVIWVGDGDGSQSDVLLSLSRKVCMAVEPMSAKQAVVVLCDRRPNHTGKHMCRLASGGRLEWWRLSDSDQFDGPGRK